MTRFSPVKCAFDGITICIETRALSQTEVNWSSAIKKNVADLPQGSNQERSTPADTHKKASNGTPRPCYMRHLVDIMCVCLNLSVLECMNYCRIFVAFGLANVLIFNVKYI